jgi:hypothetical protein
MQWFLWILAIALSAGAGLWVYRADKNRAVPYPWLTALLRSLVVLLTFLLLIAPTITIDNNKTQKPIILFLQDNSLSAGNALGTDSNRYQQDAEKLLDRLEDKYRVVKWGFGSNIVSDTIYNYKQGTTDIAGALAKAQEYYGGQNLGAVILATDGRYNQGINPLYQQLSMNSSLYTVGIGDSTTQKDIRITGVYANRYVSLNSQFEIRADFAATLCNGYNNTATISEGGSTLGSNAVNINSDRYDRSMSFVLKATKAGLHHYTIQIPAAEGEVNKANNRRDIFVEVVDEQKNVLILANAPHPDVNAIKEALSGMESYKVTVKTVDNMPANFNEYQAVILHQVPSFRMPQIPQLQTANKPVWYILGNQTHAAALNQMQKLAIINNQGAARDLFAATGNNFNTFTLPQQMQAVIDRMPPLSVSAANVQVNASANVFFTQRDDAKVPLWVLQQGNVPMAMLMGEGLWRWRLYEYKNFGKHDVIDECIRQTVTFLTANANAKPFQVSLPKYMWSDNEAIVMNAYLLNTNNEQINTPEAQVAITDSAGNRQTYNFEKSGNAYRLNIGIRAGGSYNYTATTTLNGKTYTASGSFAVQGVPLELMETGADYRMLYSLARNHNGSLVSYKNISGLYDSITRNENIKPVIQTDTKTAPLVDWKWYFFLILIMAVAEWLLRKYWLAQ